jgi:hypothetical protein
MKRNSVRGLILLFVAVQLAWLLKPKVGSRPPHPLILAAAKATGLLCFHPGGVALI